MHLVKGVDYFWFSEGTELYSQWKIPTKTFRFYFTLSIYLEGICFSFVAVNYFLSITAILGNAVILVALHKESSIHPPSKLLCSCLAVTDLLAGIILQPVVAVYFTSIGIGDW